MASSYLVCISPQALKTNSKHESWKRASPRGPRNKIQSIFVETGGPKKSSKQDPSKTYGSKLLQEASKKQSKHELLKQSCPEKAFRRKSCQEVWKLATPRGLPNGIQTRIVEASYPCQPSSGDPTAGPKTRTTKLPVLANSKCRNQVWQTRGGAKTGSENLASLGLENL
jgi:hypothetical protein